METPNEEFLTAREVAALLKVSVATVYRMAEGGALPYFQLGGKGHSIRFLKSELLAEFRHIKAKTISEIQESERPIPGPKPKWLTKS
ncbi:helix-turn-helix transcriptional regulator [Planctomicrobium sp. SH527]|uniref:helix-turn-helix transcriptional regulator n=1 Tax=Planctomicrobium sp. SH527 TaxID=3448123 RepID=UPI003F5C189D